MEVELIHKLDDGPLEAVHSLIVIQVRHKVLAKDGLVLHDLILVNIEPRMLKQLSSCRSLLLVDGQALSKEIAALLRDLVPHSGPERVAARCYVAEKLRSRPAVEGKLAANKLKCEYSQAPDVAQ